MTGETIYPQNPIAFSGYTSNAFTYPNINGIYNGSSIVQGLYFLFLLSIFTISNPLNLSITFVYFPHTWPFESQMFFFRIENIISTGSENFISPENPMSVTYVTWVNQQNGLIQRSNVVGGNTYSS